MPGHTSSRRLGMAGLAALSIAAGVAAGWGRFHDEIGDPPAEIDYAGCRYVHPGPVVTLAEAIAFEHQAQAYATTPVVALGHTPVFARPFYGLAINQGDTMCGDSPMDVYVALAGGRLQRYTRDGGP